MTPIEIKYKYDNEQSAKQIAIICWTIVIGVLLSSLLKSFLVGVLFFLASIVEYLIFKKPDGVLNITTENESLQARIEENNKVSFEKISSYKFRWSYNFLTGGKGGEAGNNATGHVNFIFTRVEFLLENGKVLILGRELNQWAAPSKDLAYEQVKTPENLKIGITSYHLSKLEKELVELEKINKSKIQSPTRR